MIWIGAVQMVVVPIFFYPYSKALWLAGDLMIRAPTAADFAAHPGEGENA